MDFSFTEEQSMLRDTLASYLADNYDFEKRRAAVKSESGWRPEVWKAFAEELGILGAAFPEAQGGLGYGALENMIVMEEMGRALAVEPYLETVVVGGSFIRHGKPAFADELAGEIIAGSTTLAFAYAEPQGRYAWHDLKTTAKKEGSGWSLSGHKATVAAAPWVDKLIVTARTGGGQRDRNGISVFLVDKGAKGVTTRDYPTVDGRRASDITFENVSLPADALIGAEGAGLPLIETAMDEACAASMGEAIGVLRKLHEGTIEYTKQRKQFGQPIASFQVLQHRMVDMFIALEQAISMTYMAHVKLDGPERAKSIAAAKVQVGRSLTYVGQQAIQLHGGMGMTDEMAISHYFKRATMLERQFGNTDHHLKRYEDLSLGAAA